MHPYAPYLPATRLELVCGPVTLRIPTGDEIAALAASVAAGGLDDPVTRQSLAWWYDEPSAAASSVVPHVTEAVSRCAGDSWMLMFAVFVDGAPIGIQDVHAVRQFSQMALVASGSWLLNTHRRCGYGLHARASVLAPAFALGAERAVTGWRQGNQASVSVADKLGYVTDGVEWVWHAPDACRTEFVRAYVTRELYEAAQPPAVEIRGLDGDVRTSLHAM